jgi:predicted helicase
MMHAAPLTRPEDVAWFLASYARDARARIEAAKQLPALEEVRKALETGLGLSFAGDKGEHFFRSTLVQTLFYGLFSAWVLWAEDHAEDDKFNWKSAEWELHLPVIRELFSQLSVPDKLRPLGLVEVMDWSAGALSRVVRSEFFTKFEQSQAVQYFYEPFLEAFDPDLRKQFGVWYTPPEVVRYMVERVDRVLKSELGLARGLADENVYVLDPCTGTGSYVVEVLRRIHQTLQDEGTDALGGDDLKQAALSRIFGFEIMPAPFVVAHLQIGLLLRQLGSSLDEDERPSVYLTNALTGWDKLSEEQVKLAFPGLEEERDAARKVKQETPILVIIGNPPYNAFDGVSPKEEGGLVEEYKKGLIKEWGIKKFNLDDLYVRFFRIAERRIVKSGKGVMCYISNASYLGDPSYVVMRQHLLSTFDRLWLDNLNGDSRETGKLTPQGKPDPSIFSTAQNKEGIRVGTAIGLTGAKW